MPTKLNSQSTFKQTVLQIVRNIPVGQVLSYKAVATKAGRPKAVRAVATIMSHNYDLTVPCHRVIHSSGKVGDYNRGGAKQKLAILLVEGWNQKLPE